MKVKELIKKLEKLGSNDKVYVRNLSNGSQAEVVNVRSTGGQVDIEASL